MMNKSFPTLITLFGVLALSIALQGCGADNDSIKSESNQENLEAGDKDVNTLPANEFDHTVLLKENQPITSPLTSLGTELDDLGYVLKLQSNGFPNIINKVTLTNGDIITDHSEIEELFILFIDPQTGEVEIKVNKNFDFELSASTYQLDISLGTESITVLVKLFDIQTGSAEEPLKISSYNELKSFFSGQYVSENIGHDVIELSNPDSSSHNVDNLHIQLDRDIDASSSANDPWVGHELHGELNGDSYVINNLTTAIGKGFINNQTRFKIARIKHIGFVDAQLSATLISSSAYGSELNTVFVSGIVKSTHSSSFNFAPFRVAGEFNKVYTNLLYDLSSISTSSNGRIELSAFLGSASAPINFRSGYSNGSIHMNKEVRVNTMLNGLSAGYPDLSDFGYTLLKDSLFYSAIDFEASENQDVYGNRAYVQVGGLGNSYIDYPQQTAEDSAYNWRFITDRNMTGRLQAVGNSHQDTNNDGQANEDGIGPDLSFAGMTSTEAQSSASYSGIWTDSQSVFDITDGEFPVLKGMPYPHTPDAHWMKAEFEQDPGIAHQRATFNDFITRY